MPPENKTTPADDGKRHDCSITYTCKNNEGKVENDEIINQYGLSPAQRVVFEAVIAKHMAAARAELLKAGLLNAVSKGRISKEEADLVTVGYLI